MHPEGFAPDNERLKGGGKRGGAVRGTTPFEIRDFGLRVCEWPDI
jgi:hypothetical protein